MGESPGPSGTSAGDSRPSPGTAFPTRVALYLRVSTDDQDLAGQERDLQAYAASRAWTVVARYAEKVSGTGRVERKERERLLVDACQTDRPWDRLLVWSLDRWSRDPSFVRAVGEIEGLESLGVSFHSFREPLLDSSEDGSASMGRDLLRAILPVIAAFESRRKSERVRVAMREIKEGRRRTRSGRPPGRPRLVTPDAVARIRTLRGTGMKWAQIAQVVGMKSETCRRAVREIRWAEPAT